MQEWSRFWQLASVVLQGALQTIAASLGEDAQAYTPHSLRFGGASAMWAGGSDSYVLRSWGRWNSNEFFGLPVDLQEGIIFYGGARGPGRYDTGQGLP